MPVSEWPVGAEIWNGVAVYTPAGAKVATGTMPIQYILDDNRTVKYLQDDLTTISTTPNTVDVPHVAVVAAHAHLFSIPESFRGLRGESSQIQSQARSIVKHMERGGTG